jgi:hypothetical protein
VPDPLNDMPEDDVRRALELIRSREGEIARTADLRGSIPGFKVQRGIFKPATSKYALWVRETDRGKYPDGDPVRHPDGSWTYRYSPEIQGEKGDQIYTNRSLQACLRDRVPVGVFRQVPGTRKSPEYKILGLAFVESYDGRHFVLRGEPIDETVAPAPQGVAPPFVPFEPNGARVAELVRKLRERRFSSVLRDVYHERCGLCELGYRFRGRSFGLDGAHLIPVESNGILADVRNGILLCQNHHSLFDAYAWTFDEDYRVLVASDRDFRKSAEHNHLLSWEGKRLPNLPEQAENRPATQAILWRMDRFLSQE